MSGTGVGGAGAGAGAEGVCEAAPLTKGVTQRSQVSSLDTGMGTGSRALDCALLRADTVCHGPASSQECRWVRGKC